MQTSQKEDYRKCEPIAAWGREADGTGKCCSTEFLLFSSVFCNSQPSGIVGPRDQGEGLEKGMHTLHGRELDQAVLSQTGHS